MYADIKPVVRNLLIGDSGLVTLLGGEKVYSVLSPEGTKYPYITITEIGNEGIDYGDDQPTRSDNNVQVDVWSKTDYDDIVAQVDIILTTAGFVRYFATDMYEYDTRVFHKPLRYWIAKELS